MAICPAGLSRESRGKRPASGEQLVEDDAKAENVSAAIDAVPLAAGLLRTHVGRRPGVAGAVDHVLVPQRQSEVGDERTAGGVEEDVARLDVTVDDAALVGVLERLGDRRDQRRAPGGARAGRGGSPWPGCGPG